MSSWRSNRSICAKASTASIIEKGILADNFVVETVLKKFEDHQPLYRQAVGIQRDAQIEVSQATPIPYINDSRSLSAPKGKATRSPWQRHGFQTL